MIRKLVLAVSLAVGSLPLSVYGIGLGDIKTYSALNQNFRGEIQLLSVPKGELDTMRVKLASREAFAKVGSDYLHFLNQLKFEPVRRKDGAAVILVTTNNVIREPFLDFLVEVNWPNGRLVKEYTVLLDPPLTTKRRPAEISKPRISRKKQATPAAAVPERPATTAPETEKTATTPDVYGPVAANETAWEIAAKLKPQGISIHQMMMALLYANPHAFVSNNINRLKKGSMLRVPGVDEIKALKHREAVASFKQQTDEWKEKTAKTADLPATAEASEEPAAVKSLPAKVDEEARLQIATARPETDGVAGASETGAAGQTSNEEIKHELMLARENAETSRLETDDLKAKVNDMAAQLEEMKNLLILQDEELARLRARVSTETEAPTAAPVEASADSMLTEAPAETEGAIDQEKETTDTVATSEAEPAVEPVEDAAPTDAPAETGEAIDQEKETTDTAATSDSEPVVEPVEDAAAAGTEPEAVAAAEKPVEMVADSSKQTSWLEDNLTMIAAAAAGLFGMGVLIALVRGRGKKQPLTAEVGVDDEAFTPRVYADKSRTGSQAVIDQGKPSDNKHPAESLQASADDSVEVDPLAAADVYIAYGRYEEAQKVLEDEIAGDDKSVPIRLKLLEVYFATKNQKDFAKLAGEMVADGQDKEKADAWEHIRDMGKQLDKFNPLFWAAGAASPGVEKSELSMDLSNESNELGSGVVEDVESLGGMEDLQLDLSSFGTMGSDETSATLDLEIEEDDLGTTLVETELGSDLEDLSDLDGFAGTEEETGTDGSDEDINFVEPIQDIEMGDEVDTKIELARAYMEMGDNQGAMSILKEVLGEGTGDQISSASEMIAKINS